MRNYTYQRASAQLVRGVTFDYATEGVAGAEGDAGCREETVEHAEDDKEILNGSNV